MEYIYCIKCYGPYANINYLDICFRTRGEAAKYLTDVKNLPYYKECDFYHLPRSFVQYYIKEIPIAHFSKDGTCNVQR